MPPTDILLSFAAAAFAVIPIPGPTVLLVTGYALAGGWRAAALCIAGVCLGDMVALTFLGLGAVLAASASLFTFLKWIGAFYLIYLGVQLWRAPVAAAAPETLEARADQQTLALHRIVSRVFNRTGASCLVGAGIYTATLRHGGERVRLARPDFLVAVCVSWSAYRRGFRELWLSPHISDLR